MGVQLKIEEFKKRCEKESDPDELLYHSINGLNEVQESSRYLLKKLDEMYTEGMPAERTAQCKQISEAFWNLQVETLRLTPLVRSVVYDKMIVGNFLECINTGLKNVDVSSDANIPGDLKQMKEVTIQKL